MLRVYNAWPTFGVQQQLCAVVVFGNCHDDFICFDELQPKTTTVICIFFVLSSFFAPRLIFTSTMANQCLCFARMSATEERTWIYRSCKMFYCAPLISLRRALARAPSRCVCIIWDLVGWLDENNICKCMGACGHLWLCSQQTEKQTHREPSWTGATRLLLTHNNAYTNKWYLLALFVQQLPSFDHTIGYSSNLIAGCA